MLNFSKWLFEENKFFLSLVFHDAKGNIFLIKNLCVRGVIKNVSQAVDFLLTKIFEEELKTQQ
jgi:hypothetical protein